jgi:hypothetical protein
VSSSGLDPRRRAFADAIGRLIADQVWAEITGQSSPKNGDARQVVAGKASIAGDERVEATRARADAHP